MGIWQLRCSSSCGIERLLEVQKEMPNTKPQRFASDLKEGTVVAGIEGIQELAQVWDRVYDSQDLWCIHDLVLESDSIQCDQACHHSVEDALLVGEQLCPARQVRGAGEVNVWRVSVD